MTTVKGSTALVRLAGNPACEVIGAMVLQPGSERKFYERVVGEPYDREFGERQSSKRRGSQFERNAYAGDGRLLREAFAPYFGTEPEQVVVCNLLDHFPGDKDDARIARLGLTREILKASASGQAAPHIVIQPQLLLNTRPGPRPYFFIAPDLLVRSPVDGVYLPGDLKSFIVRENEVSQGDLARVRLQLGAQLLALKQEYHSVDPAIVVPPQGMLIFSKPNGLNPHAPRVEDLGGAVEAIRIAIGAFLRHRKRIDSLRAGAEPYTVVADLSPNFQEACLSSCVMAQWCRTRVEGVAADMGDVAKDVLGEVSIAHIIALLTGTTQPVNEAERSIAARLQGLKDQFERQSAA